ncbi:type II toxin-antitoxin system HicB family antitoxin [Candidatus Dependentiae bacterium]|nr:type II toxin-antitoxin system HicB family antitoxin [Candidatus Dependentiae bacterium]
MVTKKKNKNLNYYRNLPWTYTVEEDKDNQGKKIYIISVNELPGIKTDAYDREEAFELIKEAMEAMFELYMEIGKKIPEPKPITKTELKGKITYRTTPERHSQLAQEAKKRKKPINKLIDEFIGNALSAQKK